MLDPEQAAALKVEMTTDPQGYGYAPLIAAIDYIGLADMINLVRSEISVTREQVPTTEVLDAINVNDFLDSSTAKNLESAWLDAALQYPMMPLFNADGSKTRTHRNVVRCLSSGTQTETRLAALRTKKVSRAEELFGAYTVVTWGEIRISLVV